MDYVTCTGCNGRKKVVGLGSFERDCSSCKGIGYVEKSPDDIVYANPVSGTVRADVSTIENANDIIDGSLVVAEVVNGCLVINETNPDALSERKAELDKLIKQAEKEEKKRAAKPKKKAKKKHTTSRLRIKE